MKSKYSQKLQNITIISTIIVFILILSGYSGEKPVPKNETNSVSETSSQETIIKFSTLREWRPQDDKNALGLEILIDEKDATEENIISLAKSLSTDTSKAVIKIYQDKEAWEEQNSNKYTIVYDKGYLAYYVKNLTNSDPYNGFNEVRWFQVVGQLEDLYGTISKL